MKTAYFDMMCGAAGDMIIGSMLDAGLDFDKLRAELGKIPISGYRLRTEKTTRHHISATRFIVQIEESKSHRKLKDIEKIIGESGLNDKIKSGARQIFKRLAEAEAKVHGESIENVHFHEVGMTDAIIDICGAVIGFDILGIDKAFCSGLTVGKGLVSTQHGTMPVPSPATAELIIGFPCIKTDIDSEILTPTGAAVITTLCTFKALPEFQAERVGYGAGSGNFDSRPNLLRLFLGNSDTDIRQDKILRLETNLDRTSPEQVGFLMDNLFEAGALDVYITPILMKKSRPGQILSVLCRIDDESRMSGIIFSSGATLGIRRERIQRRVLARTEKTIKTGFGEISVKLANHDGKVLYFPEYDSVVRAARQSGLSFDEVYFEIISQLRKES